MNSEQIANIIYDAIDLAVSKQVADAGYDKTIQAQILECLDATTGKYYVQYQDSKFTAYAENIEVVYPINSTVLILIPNNDWTQEKVIVGAKTKKSINYVSNVSPYINIEDNLVGEWLENFGIYGNQKTQVLYDSTTNLIDFDADTFNELAKQNQYISIAAMFRTEIPKSQRYNGTYGIKVTLNNTVLTFDIDDMIGTPYSFNTNTKQSKVYEINSETFTNIEKIELFIDFPSGDPVIVYLSHLELNVARKMSDAEIAGPWLYIIPNYKGTFTSSVNNIILNTEIYIKRQKIDSSTQPLAYYWFRENLDAVEGHVDYLNYGGKGWQCINSFTPIEYDENGVVSKKNWVTNQSTISLKKEDFNIKKTTIKCVVIYDEETKLNAETIIINNDAPNYDLKIKSTHGENFNFNIEGGNTLTCEIFTREGDNLTQITDVSNYEFTWVKEDVNKSFTRVKSWTKGDNQYKVDFSSLRLNATFKCEVKQIINGVATLLGTTSIKLQNAAAEETLYQLIISNNSQLFKYDASGRSPASSFSAKPQPILPLDFTLYDATGKPIDKTKISNIQWSYPTKDSFITEVTIGEEPEEGKERLPYPLSFKILSKFNGNYSPQEKITLSVVYNGKTYQAEANILFLKDGDSGTNGTDMFCRIVPVVQPTEKEYPMITSLDFSKNTLYNNYKVELYKNGSLIDSNSYTVDWNIWKSEADKALYKFTEAGKIALGDIAGDAAGVLKATVNFNSKKYYAAYPLIYLQYLDETNTPVIKLKYGTGFSEVTYDANGNFPAYKGSNDFIVEVENIESPTITWTTSNSQLTIDKAEKLSASISAADSIDGLTLNNNIICNIDNIATMYIPIHMALNKFGLANINEWDGTSVKINEDEEYILTPQIGAGEKDADNTFTGLVMGKVKTSNITDIGLFGYSHGTRSIFLDAKTGKAEFGLPDSKIIIDPTNGQARITGGGYSETNKTGMLIDLAEPAIKWGNGNFIVDKDGNVQLNGNIIWGAAASPTQVVYANSQIAQPENGSSWISFPEISSTDWHRVKQSDDYWGSYTYDGGNTWTAPMQIVGQDGQQGPPGESGSTVKTAYLYYLKSGTSSTAPPTPVWNGSGNLPSGWTTSPSGVSSTHIWEFISQAIVTDGIYGAWSTPVVWARYGSDGANGTDATVTMTNVFNALTNNGVNQGVFTWENNNKTSILINADYIRSKVVEAELVLSKHVLAENIEATGGKIGGCEIKNGVLQISTVNITDKLTADKIETSKITLSVGQVTGAAAQTSLDATNNNVSNNATAISNEASRAQKAEENLSAGIQSISNGLTAYVKADTTGEQTSWKLTKDAFLIYSKASSTASDVEVLRVDKNGLKVTGAITATSGTFNNCTIEDTCTIKGKLTFDNLPSNIATTENIPTKTSDLTNDSDFKTGTQVTTITENTIKTTSVEAQNLVVQAAKIKGKLTADQIETSGISFTSLKDGNTIATQTFATNKASDAESNAKTAAQGYANTAKTDAVTAANKHTDNQIASVNATIGTIQGGLAAKVSTTSGNASFGWEILTDRFLIKGNNKEVLKVTSTGLSVVGAITATSGTFNNCTIENTCTIKGKLTFDNLPNNVATQEFATNKASDAESNAKSAAQGYANTAESNAKSHTDTKIIKVNASIAAVNGELAAKVSNESGTASFGWVIKTDQFTIKSNNEEVLKVTSGGLSVKGAITATSGTFDNCTINSSCTMDKVKIDSCLRFLNSSTGRYDMTLEDTGIRYYNTTSYYYEVFVNNAGSALRMIKGDRILGGIAVMPGAGRRDIDLRLYGEGIFIGDYANKVGPDASNYAPYIVIGSKSSTDSSQVYIRGDLYSGSSGGTTSDANEKHDIISLSSKYEILFNHLIPRLYKYNDGLSNRIHTGFIAQEVKQALESANLTTQDFAAYLQVKELGGEKTYLALRYEEFIALNTYMIQKQQKRIDELETTVKLLQNKLNSLA